MPVDKPFLDAVREVSRGYSRDVDDGDVIWLVPEVVRSDGGSWQLARDHWEVLTLGATVDKLLAAETMRRSEFGHDLRMKPPP
ncbi:MAG: hypothetical protein OXF07_09695 [Rhodobacter sp.]|nr:hypothetical protein [Rhodobacter sp.]MCY4242425.1 hypothetical protein [Rhodobacter sp.]